MAIIANDTQFIGIAPSIDLTGKKSALLNAETLPVTMADIIETAGGGGGGLEGSSYVFVAANGTPEENAVELQAAYDLAETKVATSEVAVPIPLFYMGPTFNVYGPGTPTDVYMDYAFYFPYPSGQTYNWVINGVTYSGYLQAVQSNRLTILFVGVPSGNYNNLAIKVETFIPATVMVAPGLYDFDVDFIADKPYVNIVSLDGNRSVIFNGSGTIRVDADNIFVKGIDVQDKVFKVKYNLLYTVIDNCKGGDYSFSDPNAAGLACTLNNCEGGDNSFGNLGGITGSLTNCKGGAYSFGASQTVSYSQSTGTFTDCEAGVQSFEFWASPYSNPVTGAGRYIRCKGGSNSFGGAFANNSVNVIGNFMLGCQVNQYSLIVSGSGVIIYTYNSYSMSPINVGFSTQSQL